jgi:hypothetical protein
VAQWKDTHPLLPIQPVKKGYGSVDMGIQIINADIKAERLFFVEEPTSTLRTQMATLIWDTKASPTGARRVKRGDGYPDHCADSFRYAYTKVRTWKSAEYSQGVMMGRDKMERDMARIKQEVMNERGDEARPFWQRLIKK